MLKRIRPFSAEVAQHLRPQIRRIYGMLESRIAISGTCNCPWTIRNVLPGWRTLGRRLPVGRLSGTMREPYPTAGVTMCAPVSPRILGDRRRSQKRGSERRVEGGATSARCGAVAIPSAERRNQRDAIT